MNKKIKTIDFYYFSGTGNTLLVVSKMKETFVKNNINVNLFKIENHLSLDTIEIYKDHIIGLAFPVVMQGTYPFVWEFIRKLPKVYGVPIFMVDTMMFYSGGIVGPVKKIVKKKGYIPIGAKEIIMPSNLLVKKLNEKKSKLKINRGIKKAKEYAIKIIAGESRWGRIPIFSSIMSLFSRGHSSWKLYRKFFKISIDTIKCTKCGLCIKLCPISNIKFNKEGFPNFSDKCVFCMRCYSFCPSEAIRLNNKDYKRYKAVKASDLLKKLNSS